MFVSNTLLPDRAHNVFGMSDSPDDSDPTDQDDEKKILTQLVSVLAKFLHVTPEQAITESIIYAREGLLKMPPQAPYSDSEALASYKEQYGRPQWIRAILEQEVPDPELDKPLML